MSSHLKVDYLIIGQGLAGSCLALQLIKRGRSVFVFDEPEKNRASSVAAGLFNPVTGKLMTKTWKADKLFTYLQSFYAEAEDFLKSRFYYPFPLYRPFISVEEQNEWMGKSAEPGMMEYIESVFGSSTFSADVHDPFGGLLLKGCGYLDVPTFVKKTRDFLTLSHSFREAHFDESKVEFINSKISYGELVAGKIIFCNGLGSLQNHFFKSIPLRPLKGETLSIQIDDTLERVYNRGVYVVPSRPGVYKVGATYNTKDKNDGTTENGRAELVEKLNSLLRLSYKELNQDWGFRPTTPDRRPILGSHFTHPDLVMFNGLGTKGVSLAPYFSNQLADWLTHVGEIDEAVDIKRFY